MKFKKRLEMYFDEGKISETLKYLLLHFYETYQTALSNQNKSDFKESELMHTYLDCVLEVLEKPYDFGSYHQQILKPFDFYQFGLDFVRPLVRLNSSKVLGLEHVQKMEEQLNKGENIILFGNHQTEPDPQAISLLLEHDHPQFAKNIIFIAGHLVTSDPLAVPFSKGRNLLCVFSKKRLGNKPEEKQEKLSHNQRTIQKMLQLLDEGGKTIYVAPSGGRDRPNQQKRIDMSPFDPKNIEMFTLVAKKSNQICHFYPIALATFFLIPPSNNLDKEIGEKRVASKTEVFLAFGPEIDMNNFPGCDEMDKKRRRENRAQHAWSCVNQIYSSIRGYAGY